MAGGSRATRSERGSLAPAVPVLAMALLLIGGLTIDASRQLNARGQAVAIAEEAARAGAQAIDLAEVQLTLDEPAAEERVRDFCDRVEDLGEVETCRFLRVEPVSGDDPRRLVVVTEVELSIPATLLGIVGVERLDAGAEARARPYEGIVEPEE